MANKAKHVVSLPINARYQPVYPEFQHDGRTADFYARQGEYVVVSPGGVVFTGFAHHDAPERESAEHFARSMGWGSGEAYRPFVLRVQPYWYAAAFGALSEEQADTVREVA